MRGFRPVAVRYAIVGVAIGMFGVISILSPAFLTKANLANLLDEWAPAGIMAVGLTVLLVSGGFDLSAGAVFGLCGVIAAKVVPDHGALAGVAIGILGGALVGLCNGLLVALAQINSFVATLATSTVIGGVSLALTHGTLISVNDTAFTNIAQATWGGFRATAFLLLIFLVIGALVLHLTVFGRRIYAVGGNAAAARLAGVAVKRTQILAYVFMGVCAGFAGVVQAASVAGSEANAGGLTLLFNVFAIVIVGGTSLMGGEGAMWRTAVGVAILAMISDAFVLLNLSAVYQQISFGGIILVAVAADSWARGRRRTR